MNFHQTFSKWIKINLKDFENHRENSSKNANFSEIFYISCGTMGKILNIIWTGYNWVRAGGGGRDRPLRYKNYQEIYRNWLCKSKKKH